jgi:hypothetical protein
MLRLHPSIERIGPTVRFKVPHTFFEIAVFDKMG